MCIYMHMVTSSLTSTMFLLYTNSSQPGWFHIETYKCVLGL